MKLKFETKGFVKDIEIDGGAVMNSLIVTYMWVQTTPGGRTSGPR